MNALLTTATQPRVKELLAVEIRRCEKELLKLKVPDVKATPTRFTCEIKNYGWDQSDKYVKLFVTLSGVQKCPLDNVVVKYNNQQDVELIVKDLENKDHKLEIKNLLNPIVAEKSFHKIKTDMLVVYMLKESPGRNWDYLTKTAMKVSVASKADATEGMMDDNPNAALMNIMKKMYETGDASTKQMIEKAYTENMNKTAEL